LGTRGILSETGLKTRVTDASAYRYGNVADVACRQNSANIYRE